MGETSNKGEYFHNLTLEELNTAVSSRKEKIQAITTQLKTVQDEDAKEALLQEAHIILDEMDHFQYLMKCKQEGITPITWWKTENKIPSPRLEPQARAIPPSKD